MVRLEEKLEIAIKACDAKLASDVITLDIGEFSTIADYFVIASGSSVTQTQAIAEEVEYKMELNGYEAMGKEGIREGKWIILDYEDIVVHIFHKDLREYYNLEKLWTNRKLED